MGSSNEMSTLTEEGDCRTVKCTLYFSPTSVLLLQMIVHVCLSTSHFARHHKGNQFEKLKLFTVR